VREPGIQAVRRPQKFRIPLNGNSEIENPQHQFLQLPAKSQRGDLLIPVKYHSRLVCVDLTTDYPHTIDIFVIGAVVPAKRVSRCWPP
jgi:hypothetical protein